MSEQKITFNVGGKILTAEQFEAQAEKKKPKPKTGPGPFFKGYRVSGYPPGYVVESERLQNQAHRTWLGSSRKDRDPGLWVFETWARKHKLRRIGRSYEIHIAEQTCADIAKRDGWTHVSITALERE